MQEDPDRSRRATKVIGSALSFAFLLFMLGAMWAAAAGSGNKCSKLKGYKQVSKEDILRLAVHKEQPTDPLIDSGTVDARVTVTVFVDEHGRVVCARTVGKANPLLGAISEKAARKWRFQPANEAERPRQMKGDIQFHIRR